MAAPPKSDGITISEPRQLVEYMVAGVRSKEQWRIGTEHEKFVFKLDTREPAPYDGPWGIRMLLEGLTRFGWQPVLENGNPIALTKGDCNVTLEPGGQFELSGAQLETLHQTCDEVHMHLREVKEVASELGVGLLGMGFHPTARREDVHWMPKGRYRIMRTYMPKKGTLGLDMMLRTCTVQVNLDVASEADMVRKFRVGLALQPIAVAIFANSPFVEGKPTGYLSYRSHVWENTDPDRCGMLPFVFEPGMGYERYVDYMLDVPMYFVYRDGRYIDASGQSFRDFLKGRLAALPGETPLLSDWADHLTTAFPEVRLKRYLEMRGTDGGPWRTICALPALWTGLLYDQTALDAAWDLVKNWTTEDHALLRREVPKTALKTTFRGRTVGAIAANMLEIARAGLVARRRFNRAGDNEAGFLGTLDEIVAGGQCAAETQLGRYHGEWNGVVDRAFDDYAY